MPRLNLDIFEQLFHRAEPHKPPSLVVVGMGNPGATYAKSRHNVGFWFIDKLAIKHSISLERKNRSTHLGEAEIEGRRFVISKPRTHVNGTGQAIRYLFSRYRIKRENLLLVYDDIALSPGIIRIRSKGGAAGHNGVKSVISALGTHEFPRLRIGVGRPNPGTDQVAYVLGEASSVDRKKINDSVDKAVRAVSSILLDGINTAMNKFN